MRNTLPLGTFSEGTLKPDEVGNALVFLLEPLHLTREHRQLVRNWYASIKLRDLRPDEFDDASLQELLDELWAVVDDYVPPYCYVGALEGDGACFGVWVSKDALNWGLHDRELITVGDLSDVPKGHTGDVLYTNDHGNQTLYRYVRGRAYEQWATV